MFHSLQHKMRIYKPKTSRQELSQVSTEKAIEACLTGQFGYKRAATEFKVPRSTLRNRVKKAKGNGCNATQAAQIGMGRYNTVFTTDQEQELVSYLLEMETKLFGMTYADLNVMVYPTTSAENYKKLGKTEYGDFLDITLS